MGSPRRALARALRLARGSDRPTHREPVDPTTASIADLLNPRARGRFVAAVGRTGDPEIAGTRVVRSLMRRGTMGQARTFAQVLQQNPATSVGGDVCRALIALRDEEPERAWELLSAHDPQRVLTLAPAELLRAGLVVAPREAEALLDRLRDGQLEVRVGPRVWRDIAWITFAVGLEEMSAWALDRAVNGAGDTGAVADDAAWLRRWYGRRGSADSRLPALEHGQTAIAILDEDHPRRSVHNHRSDADVGQHAVLDAATRHSGVNLYRAGRDATSYADVPDGTWLVVTGPLPRPLFGMRTDLPYDERYRPVFASIRITDGSPLTDEVVDQLRRCAPVGCADWDTYYLLRGLDVPAFLADDLPDAVDVLVQLIVNSNSTDAVYRGWQAACAAAVAAGERLDSQVDNPPSTRFDVALACRQVRSRSVTVERSDQAPDGPEINLEFSLDGNLKRHMVVVLDSIVRRSSRPIRLYVLCRDHEPADFTRLAELFPTVSFEWLPTDSVDYGDIGGMVEHITVATMDRLLLPDLLPNVARVIHHDLDAVCLTDLADLDAVDLLGHPIAAVTSPRARYRSGLGGFRGTAQRLRKEGLPDRARELIQRTHLRHGRDFDSFNAGVMVLDLDRMRADEFCREFFPYAEQFGLNDQAVLNAYAGHNRLELDPSWNWCPRLEDMAHPRIAHWSGPVKPWGDGWVSGQQLWRDAEALATSRVRTPRATAVAT